MLHSEATLGASFNLAKVELCSAAAGERPGGLERQESSWTCGSSPDTIFAMPSDSTTGPLFYQPEPDVLRWIMRKLERLERRGPREYIIVDRRHDGRPAEARIMPMSFKMKGV